MILVNALQRGLVIFEGPFCVIQMAPELIREIGPNKVFQTHGEIRVVFPSRSLYIDTHT